ncbi:MAG: CFI-box-CTERM domain-containing protein, partial [Promethearchaeota archaeon]
VTVTPTTPITLTGASETYYIVYDVPLGAVNGRTLGARINSGIDVNSDADIVLPGGGGCFIATAAYGSHAEGHVITLRRFRDQYLLLNAIGRSLVHLYERYSPGLAKLINHNQHLIPITRVGLSPLVGLSALFGWVDLPQRWPLLVTMAVIISVLTYMELLVRRQRGFTRD